MFKEIDRALEMLEGGAEPGAFTACFAIDPAWDLFAGHFPAEPLLPGVMEIEMVRSACERFLGRPCFVKRIAKAKFTGKILPGSKPRLDAKICTQDGLSSVKATLYVDSSVVAVLSLALSEA